LPQVYDTIRSERMLIDEMDYNLLFHWFAGSDMGDPIWDPTVLTKNRQMLLEGKIAPTLFKEVLALARERNLLSDENLSVDAALIAVWARHENHGNWHKELHQEPDDPRSMCGEDLRGGTRTNATHEIGTDPEARPFRKGPGKEAKLHNQGPPHGKPIRTGGSACLTRSSGKAECQSTQQRVRAAKQRRGGGQGFRQSSLCGQAKAAGRDPPRSQTQ